MLLFSSIVLQGGWLLCTRRNSIAVEAASFSDGRPVLTEVAHFVGVKRPACKHSKIRYRSREFFHSGAVIELLLVSPHGVYMRA